MKNYLNEALEREAKGIESYFEYEIDKMRREVALTEGTSHYHANLAHFNRLVRIKWEVLAKVARMQGLSKGYIEGLQWQSKYLGRENEKLGGKDD